MKTLPLNELFNSSPGNKLDFNKMEVVEPNDNNAVNFIARTEKNLGIKATVKRINDLEPYKEGLITVALGGAILSSNVQLRPFYTAQNIRVLIPKLKMSLNTKLFYCLCIEKNKHKYSAFGREANVTLSELPIPANVPGWVNKVKIKKFASTSIAKNNLKLSDRKWVWFRYDDELFDIERGKGARKKDIVKNGKTPFITSIDKNNGITGYVNITPKHKGNVITVSRNGSVGEAFYQTKPFCSTEDVHVFNPKFKLNPFIAMFLLPLINKEKFKYNYGRKWGIDRMNETLIKLPVKGNNKPDWLFMEKYVKSLPYSTFILKKDKLI